jgi:hypothetical protein
MFLILYKDRNCFKISNYIVNIFLLYYIYQMKKETKIRIIPVRMTQESYEVIVNKAEQLGLTISAYLRMLALQA